jgi:predicted branched-subunit amino acid permease
LVYRAAAADDCPRLVTALWAVGCAAGAALTCALVDVRSLDIAVTFIFGVLLSPSPRTYGSNAPAAPRFLAPKA